MSELVAAVDLGTNTALLLVARRGPSGVIEPVVERCLTPRLGAGLARQGTLDDAAAARALAALAEFAGTIATAGVDPRRVRAVGTACLRRARDGAQFAARAAQATGLPLEIVSEDEEARLGELALELAGAGPAALVVDVGGGSTEVACRALHLRQSLPIGAVLLTEAWLEPERVDLARWRALCAAAQGAAETLPARAAEGRTAWAIGGTAVNLAAVHAGLPRFDPQAVEGRQVPTEFAAALAETLSALDPAARLAFPIEAERADILPAGLAILTAVLVRLGAPQVRVSGLGLRHGIARELLDRRGS
ncbi:MAG: Ppx/GppA family phosphatase [Planctomycetes bacterium]|nr:Ppx/GppA family phosphatase [Planctomycetota bacterium]